MSRVLRLLLGVTLACSAGAGCGAAQSGRSAEVATEHVGTYEAFGEGGDDALLEGTVRVADGCFVVVVEQDTAGPFLPYFPDDEVEWSDELLTYDGESYGDGDAIALGGGVSGALDPVPVNCRPATGLSRWTVAQNG